MTDLADRVAAIAEKVRTDRAEQARRNRERDPEFTAWLDDYRRVFGEVKVRRFERYTRKDGIE